MTSSSSGRVSWSRRPGNLSIVSAGRTDAVRALLWALTELVQNPPLHADDLVTAFLGHAGRSPAPVVPPDPCRGSDCNAGPVPEADPGRLPRRYPTDK